MHITQCSLQSPAMLLAPQKKMEIFYTGLLLGHFAIELCTEKNWNGLLYSMDIVLFIVLGKQLCFWGCQWPESFKNEIPKQKASCYGELLFIPRSLRHFFPYKMQLKHSYIQCGETRSISNMEKPESCLKMCLLFSTFICCVLELSSDGEIYTLQWVTHETNQTRKFPNVKLLVKWAKHHANFPLWLNYSFRLNVILPSPPSVEIFQSVIIGKQ